MVPCSILLQFRFKFQQYPVSRYARGALSSLKKEFIQILIQKHMALSTGGLAYNMLKIYTNILLDSYELQPSLCSKVQLHVTNKPTHKSFHQERLFLSSSN